MDVGAYNRNAKSIVTYQIIVTVPDNRRRANMRMPQAGSNISVRRILSYISVHEDIAGIEMENLTYLPRTDFSSKNESSPSGKTKRQLIAEKNVDTGRPMKKTKSGPIEAFTPEELGAGSPTGSNTGRSSESSTESSPSSKTKSQLIAEKNLDTTVFTPRELGAGSSTESNTESSSESNTESTSESNVVSSPSSNGTSSSRITRSTTTVESSGESSSAPKKGTKRA